MDFDEFINKITNPGENGIDNNLIEEFKTEYERRGNVANTAEHKVTELETTISEHTQTITGLKTELYDVSRKLPRAGDTEERHEVDSNQNNSQIVSVENIASRIAGKHRW